MALSSDREPEHPASGAMSEHASGAMSVDASGAVFAHASGAVSARISGMVSEHTSDTVSERAFGAAARGVRPVLMLSSNGIGLGHLSRQLAIGSRLPPSLRPVLHSQSLGIRLAREAGYATFHSQHHRYSGLGVDHWNRLLGRELLSLAAHLAPAAIVVDCTVVFGGFVRLLEAYAGKVPRIWIRRGFLSPEHKPAMQAARHFDHVIEPGDLAAELDDGPSAALRHQARAVPPILYIAPDERLPRADARLRLGLENGRPALALLLGNTLGERTARIRETILCALVGSGIQLLDIRSTLEASDDPPPVSAETRRLSLYPAFALSRGFDAMITLAGYNAFHEAMLGKIPSLFLTLPQHGMDRQDLRVDWAVRRGLALGMYAEPLTRGRSEGLAEAVGKLLSGEIQSALNGPQAPAAPNGAQKAADLIAEWVENYGRARQE